MAVSLDEFEIDKNVVRGVRCSLVVGSILTGALQEVMEHSQIKAPQVYAMIQHDKKFRDKFVSSEELNLLQTISNDGYKHLDINLMFKLMRRYKIVPSPTRGWKFLPQPCDITIGDDMRRIKEVRNFYGHNICPPRSQIQMDEFFLETSEIGTRVDLYLKKSGNSSYATRILMHKECPIDKEREDKMLKEINERRKQMEFVISVTEDTSCKFGVSQDTRQEWELNFKEDPSGSTNLKFVIDGIKNPKAISEKIKKMKTEINRQSTDIKVYDACTGSIVLFVSVKNILIHNDRRLIQEVEKFVRMLSDIVGFRFITGQNNYFIITKDEDAVDTDTSSDDEDDMVPESYTEKKQEQLILRVDAHNQVFGTDKSFRDNVNVFFSAVTSSVNGQKITERNKITAKVEVEKGISTEEFEKSGEDDQGEWWRRKKFWRKNLDVFVDTKAAQHILEKVNESQFVLISGPPGSGKSLIATYIASCLEVKEDYTIYPLSMPTEINYQWPTNSKVLLLFDDVVGDYYIDEYKTIIWGEHINKICHALLTNSQFKIVFTNRDNICDSNSFQDLLRVIRVHIPVIHKRLNSDELPLSLEERKEIYKSLNKDQLPGEITDDMLMIYENFPLICKMCAWLKEDIIHVLNGPFDVIHKHIENLKREIPNSYLGLALLVVFDNHLEQRVLISKSDEVQKIINDFTYVSELNDYVNVQDILISLKHLVYINNFFNVMSCHPRLYDIFSYWFCKQHPVTVIKHCSDYFLSQRVQLESFKGIYDEFSVILNKESEEMYFSRVFQEIESGANWEVFGSFQARVNEFREKIVAYLMKFKTDEKNIFRPDKNGFTPLHVSTWIGYIELSDFFITHYFQLSLCETIGVGLTPLHCSSIKGHYTIVKHLLENGVFVDIKSGDCSTSLHMACSNGNSDIVTLLLKYNANADSATTTGCTPMMVACSNGDYNIVNTLLNHGASVNECRENGISCLFIAIEKGRLDIVKLLLKNSELLNVATINGMTPLSVACYHRQENIVELLLLYNANLDMATKDGYYPLHIACCVGHERIVELLLKHNASPNQLNGNNKTPLIISCENNHPQIASLLIRYGANVNQKLINGLSVLHIACLNSNNEMADFLISCEIDINIQDIHGISALHICCSIGNQPLITTLLNHSARINLADNFGNTPLFIACTKGYTEVVSLLIHRNANVNEINQYGHTPLRQSCAMNSKDIVKLLLASGVSVNKADLFGCTPMHAMCAIGNFHIIELLMKHNADINVKNVTGLTCLHLACAVGQLNVVKLLVKYKANTNIEDDMGITPLHSACQEGYEDIVHFLLKNHADVMHADDNLNTPLHSACFGNHLSVVKLLTNAGVKINCSNKQKITPLHLACTHKLEDLVEFLVGKGAEVNVCDLFSITPFHIACFNESFRIAEILLNNKADPNKSLQGGITALHISCMNNNADITEMLLKKFAKVNRSCNFGLTPLHLACFEGNITITGLLLRYGSNTNAEDVHGITPLLACTCNDTNGIANLLLKNGANISHFDTEGNTALLRTCSTGNISVFTEILHFYVESHNMDNIHILPINVSHFLKIECILQKIKAEKSEHSDTLYWTLENQNGDIRGLFLQNGYSLPTFHSKTGFFLRTASLFLQLDEKINRYGDNELSLLQCACLNADVGRVEKLIKNRALLIQQGKFNLTALHVACYVGHKQTVQTLLNECTDVNCVDDNGVSPLLLACYNNHDSVVEIMLNKAASVNQCDRNGLSPLILACQQENMAMTKLLLNLGASVNHGNNERICPIHVACRHNNYSLVSLLIAYGASVNRHTQGGLSPLSIACDMANETIIDIILKSRITVSSINNKEHQNIVPLHVASCKKKSTLLEMLLDWGFSINESDRYGRTSLHFACYHNCEENVKILVQSGVKPNVNDKIGITPLDIACFMGYANICDFLLSVSADVNYGQVYSPTPLLIACLNGHSSVAHLLLQNKANVNKGIKDVSLPKKQKEISLFMSPLFVACSNDHTDVIKTLIQNKASTNVQIERGLTPIHKASWCNSTNAIKLLIESGANVNLADKKGQSPLFYAAFRGHNNALVILIQGNADVNKADNEGISPLNVATRNKNAEVIKILLHNEADVNQRDTKGNTLLHLSCEHELVDSAKLFLNFKANVNQENTEGITPLHLACESNNIKMVTLLLENGASVNQSNQRVFSPMCIAAGKDNKGIMELLLKHSKDKYMFEDIVNNLNVLKNNIKEQSRELETNLKELYRIFHDVKTNQEKDTKLTQDKVIFDCMNIESSTSKTPDKYSHINYVDNIEDREAHEINTRTVIPSFPFRNITDTGISFKSNFEFDKQAPDVSIKIPKEINISELYQQPGNKLKYMSEKIKASNDITLGKDITFFIQSYLEKHLGIEF